MTYNRLLALCTFFPTRTSCSLNDATILCKCITLHELHSVSSNIYVYVSFQLNILWIAHWVVLCAYSSSFVWSFGQLPNWRTLIFVRLVYRFFFNHSKNLSSATKCFSTHPSHSGFLWCTINWSRFSMKVYQRIMVHTIIKASPSHRNWALVVHFWCPESSLFTIAIGYRAFEILRRHFHTQQVRTRFQ